MAKKEIKTKSKTKNTTKKAITNGKKNKKRKIHVALKKKFDERRTVIGAEYVQELSKIYGANINIQRHFPEIRDGFKPVQRRCIIGLNDIMKNNKIIKSARAVGEVLGKYHPLEWGV